MKRAVAAVEGRSAVGVGATPEGWGHRFERALRLAMQREILDGDPSPGERSLVALIRPTFHSSLLIELIDLGELHEFAVAVVSPAATAFALAVACGEQRAARPPAPDWHRGELPAGEIAGLRARLEAFEAARWSAVGQGHDGISVSVHLCDGRGQQRLEWSTATHDRDGAPFELAVELLRLARQVAPAVSEPVDEARRYLEESG